jgi:hypothetical protein
MAKCGDVPYKWCGENNCRNDAKDTGTDKDKSELVGCPAGYRHMGYKKFARSVLADQYLRLCGKNNNFDFMGCAFGESSTPSDCPSNMCTKDAPHSVKYATQYCNAGNNIFDKAVCRRWKNGRPREWHAAMKSKCNSGMTNLGKPVCQEFCRDNPGECSKARDWCALNKDDPFCSCIYNDLNDIKGASAPATCFGNPCPVSGYKESKYYPGAPNQTCPTYLDCKQIVTVDNEALMENSNLQQHCSADIHKYEQNKTKEAEALEQSLNPTPVPAAVDGADPGLYKMPDDPGESSNINTVVFFMFIMFVAMVYFMFKDDSEQPSRGTPPYWDAQPQYAQPQYAQPTQ